SRRRHTRFSRDWSSDVCSSDLRLRVLRAGARAGHARAGCARHRGARARCAPMTGRLVLALCGVALLSCGPRLAIVSPADLSQADASGQVPVVIDLAFPVAPDGVTAHLLRGIDGPTPAIVPVPLAVDDTTATATLEAA